jgi:uncharacterized protein
MAFAPFAALIAAMILSGNLGTKLGVRLLAAMPERLFRTGLQGLVTVMAVDLIRQGIQP